MISSSMLALATMTILLAACSNSSMQSVAPLAGGGSVIPKVIQTGQPPTNWVFFYTNANGDIITSGTKTLWYTSGASGNPLCKIDMLGQSNCYSSGDVGARGLSVGPDKDIWFAAAGGSFIGRMNANGGLTLFPVLGEPQATVAGPDGNIWVATEDPNGIHNGV